MARLLGNLLVLLVLPFLLVGVINRVKALWSGRRGPRLWQTFFDVVRLARKQSVYSPTTTALFRLAPWVALVSALAGAAVVPLSGGRALVSFPFDFVWFAYAWGLGRLLMMLAGLDTGSSFEGMGVSREATFSTLIEPVIFLVAGALCLTTGASSLAGALLLPLSFGDASVAIWLCAVSALLVVVQVEGSRMPVDDPTTHLELTMVHEVMVLDHSGPDLAAVQLGAAVKLTVGLSLVASLLNPVADRESIAGVATHLGLCVALAAVVGLVESLTARLKLKAVPIYIAFALVTATVGLLATAWGAGS